jgi:hypothetical protein
MQQFFPSPQFHQIIKTLRLFLQLEIRGFFFLNAWHFKDIFRDIENYL